MKCAMPGLLVLSSSLLFTSDGSAQHVDVDYTPQVFHWKVDSAGNVTGDKSIDVNATRVDTAPFCWKISEVELRFDGKRADRSLQNSGAGSCSFSVALHGVPISDDEARSYCPGPGRTGPGGDRPFTMDVDLITDTQYAAYEPLRRWVQPWDYAPEARILVYHNRNMKVHVECASTDRCVKAGACSSPPDTDGVSAKVDCGSGVCVKGVCYPRTCGPCPSQTCNPDGTCVDMCAAHSHPCGPNTFCDDAKEECVTNPGCGGVICPAGRRCSNGACVASALCRDVVCASGYVCADGMCRRNPCADVTCPAGRVCYNGGCVIPEACAVVSCDDGLSCVDGKCVAPQCPETPCAMGHICQGGECVLDPRCEGVECYTGRVCSEGRCVPAPPKVSCPPGYIMINGKCTRAQPSPTPAPGPQPQPH